MSTLAVIGTFYARHERTEHLLRRVLLESTRPPDELWVMCETESDVAAAVDAAGRIGPQVCAVHFRHIPTPMNGDRYAEIPYSRKINAALERTDCDYIAYLTNDSEPHADKYRLMAEALDANPEWGAVYCSQDFGGMRRALEPISDAYCVVDHTQVMHRRTDDRWPLDVSLMRIGDATFWRSLHRSLGPFYPVSDVLDTVRQTSDGISATW